MTAERPVPSAEQVEAMRETAHRLLGMELNEHCGTCEDYHCGAIATELATVALEAEARGAAREREACADIAFNMGGVSPALDIFDAIRARGTP